jgi:LCP family protein required for cell wall assembly
MSVRKKNNRYRDDVDIPFYNNERPRKIKRKLNVIRALFSFVCIVIVTIIALSITNSLLGNGNKIPFMPSKKENILLIGVDGDISNNLSKDHVRQNGRSDTLILFNIDTKSNTVNAISIPRDSKVYIANSNDIDKINHAFAFGGPELTVHTIEDTFGIKIDHYIAVNYNVVKDIVAAVDGVNVYVEKNMHYNDNAGGLHINLRKGENTLDPETAEEFLRFRHDALGDIGRIERQQVFVTGLMKKFQNPSIIPKIPQLVKVVQDNVLTDMNMYEMSELAAYLQGANLSQMQTTMLPGTPSQRGHISYWILDPEEVQKVIDKFIYRIDDNYRTQNLTVGIAYNPKATRKTNKIITNLQDMGYTVKCTEPRNTSEGKIISHADDVTINSVNYIKKKVNPIKNYPFVLSPEIGYVCGRTDLSIVVSDY